MEIDYGEQAEKFRLEVRDFLEKNLPKGWGDPNFKMTPEERKRFNEEWVNKLREGGYICASWPKEYGGRGLTLLEQLALNEEFAKYNAPIRADFFGDTLVGPTILQWGTEEQKAFFLPKILSGEIRWCQGFSEPDAGSDLASLRTTAVLDGDEWVINGQKIWTTQAQHADYIFLLARTDPNAEKHAGISYLLVPMKQPGIEVRPIEQIDGGAEFNEVFFNNARCPKDNVVGGVNNGWKVAMTTLGFERGASATTGHRRFLKEFEMVLEIAKKNGKNKDPQVRQQLAWAWSKVKILEINGLRSLASELNKDLSAIPIHATNKMYWSEYHQRFMEIALDILGLDAQILTGKGDQSAEGQEFIPGIGTRSSKRNYPVTMLQALFFFSRSETIWGGTAQIQRNIVAERVLGLPKEPKVDKTGSIK